MVHWLLSIYYRPIIIVQLLSEIQRVNVAQVVLQLTKMGSSPLTFPYVSPPSQEVLRKALEMLLILGALEKDMSLSPHGVR